MDNEAYKNLRNEPTYSKIIKCLTNNQEKWKINHEGQVVNFKAKDLLYIPKVRHHFITSRILPTTNVFEVTMEWDILNFAILHSIKFDMGKIIEEAIWDNRDARKNLGYPFLIYQLCENAGVDISNQDEWFHPHQGNCCKEERKWSIA